MVKHFERDLSQLKEKLMMMADLAMANIYLAVKSLVERNPQKFEEVFAQEQRINALQIEIDNLCLELIALHQPVAGDLRLLASAMKINTELERIGDLAINIIQASRRLIAQPELKPLIDVPKMAELVQLMVRDSIDGFVWRNSQLARDVLKRDDTIDELKDRTYDELINCIAKDGSTAPRALQLILVSRHLERIADHATNIAEDVVYLVEGVDVRHHSESSRT